MSMEYFTVCPSASHLSEETQWLRVDSWVILFFLVHKYVFFSLIFSLLLCNIEQIHLVEPHTHLFK